MRIHRLTLIIIALMAPMLSLRTASATGIGYTPVTPCRLSLVPREADEGAQRIAASLETRIAALNPADMPSACDSDRGPFTAGTYELTLYNGAAGPAQIITVTFNHNAPAAAQCPDNVESLVVSVDGFLRYEGVLLP
ncbi:MAG TPA: hypothetical protein VN888_24990 [Mycobacterium sp.]|nr:hypothetical protein [Mycobacterium sp.]